MIKKIFKKYYFNIKTILFEYYLKDLHLEIFTILLKNFIKMPEEATTQFFSLVRKKH